MCRLFAPELIEAIATGRPPAPDAVEAIAAHIQRDWTAAGCMIDFAGEASIQVCRKLARAATVGSDDRHLLETTIKGSGTLAIRLTE